MNHNHEDHNTQTSVRKGSDSTSHHHHSHGSKPHKKTFHAKSNHKHGIYNFRQGSHTHISLDNIIIYL